MSDLAVTTGVENLGAMQQQARVHLPHTLQDRILTFVVVESPANGNVPLLATGADLTPSVPINYIRVCPSARNNQVVVSLGVRNRWISLNGVYYPIGHIIAFPSTAPVEWRIPTRRNWSIHVDIFSLNLVNGYADAACIAYGYIPDGEEEDG